MCLKHSCFFRALPLLGIALLGLSTPGLLPGYGLLLLLPPLGFRYWAILLLGCLLPGRHMPIKDSQACHRHNTDKHTDQLRSPVNPLAHLDWPNTQCALDAMPHAVTMDLQGLTRTSKTSDAHL